MYLFMLEFYFVQFVHKVRFQMAGGSTVEVNFTSTVLPPATELRIQDLLLGVQVIFKTLHLEISRLPYIWQRTSKNCI